MNYKEVGKKYIYLDRSKHRSLVTWDTVYDNAEKENRIENYIYAMSLSYGK